MAVTDRPFTTFQFSVEITMPNSKTTICDAAFSDVDGLEMTIEPKTFREGGHNSGPRHLVGGVSYGQVTLKRGMTTNVDLWNWFERVTSNGYRGDRPDAEIVMLAANRTDVQARFKLGKCMPVKMRMPALNAKEGLVAIEELSLLYESLTLNNEPPPEDT